MALIDDNIFREVIDDQIICRCFDGKFMMSCKEDLLA